MMTFDDARKILAALEREGVRYVLVGSMAMAAHGIVRATRDLDLFVEPTEVNVERLREALRSLFSDPELDHLSAADLAGEYPAIQYNPPEAPFWIDLLARLGEAFSYAGIYAGSEQVPIEGGSIRVARRVCSTT